MLHFNLPQPELILPHVLFGLLAEDGDNIHPQGTRPKWGISLPHVEAA